jgi:hypothetical protein
MGQAIAGLPAGYEFGQQEEGIMAGCARKGLLWPPIIFISIILLAGCNLPSIGGAGPAVWIDRPLDGDKEPVSQPVLIQAHASDIDGIESFEFFAAGTSLGEVAAGGERLGEASLQWQPPGPGVYLLGVQAMDQKGDIGPLASVQVTVGDATETTAVTTSSPSALDALCASDALTAPMLLSPADGATITGPSMLSWSYPDALCHPASYFVDISPDASFNDISLGFGTLDYNETSREWPLPAGQCYYWRARAYVPDVSGPPSAAWTFCIGEIAATVEPPALTLTQNANCRSGPGTAYEAVTVLAKGEKAAIEGRNAENTWVYVKPLSGSRRCWISVVAGDLTGEWSQAPIVAAPPLPATVTPVAADTTSPVISDLTANPVLISALVQCGATPAITVISARVTDAGGVQRVIARVSGVGEFDMSPAGGDLYQVALGPFSEPGTLSIFVQAWDNAGNNALSGPIEAQVVNCPG